MDGKSLHVGRLTLCLSLITLVLAGVVLGAAFFLSPGTHSAKQEGPEVMVAGVSYAIFYNSCRKAYEDSELVVVGRVVSVEYFPTKKDEIPLTVSHLEVELMIKGELLDRIVDVSQLGVGKEEEVYWIIPEDPPLEIGERVLLFLRRNMDSPSRNWYWYPGSFGRFEVVENKVYSMMHETPGLKLLGKYGLPEQKRIESATMTLKYTEYEKVNGNSLEEFIETLTAP